MSLANPGTIQLSYGATGRFSCEIDAAHVVGALAGPPAMSRFAEELRTALIRPLDFPALAQAVIPGDCVAVALDWDTPEATTIVAELWRILESRGVEPHGMRIVQPPNPRDDSSADPRAALPAAVRREVVWTVHDPADRARQAYLASASSGERIYLAREVVDADFLVSAGPIGFDPLLGYRGTNSVFFPGLSNNEANQRARGQGHVELGPDDERPLRQLVDEVAWLLGALFSVQVVPSGGAGAACVLAGAADSVLRKGKQCLAERWLIELDARPELVVAAIDRDAGGHGWAQVGAALDAARNLVARKGKIVVLSELAEPPPSGMELLNGVDAPADALRAVRDAAPADLVETTQLINALEWADVYLLSRLPGDQVEGLFLIPLEGEREVERLLGRNDSCVLLQSAQHACGRIAT